MTGHVRAKLDVVRQLKHEPEDLDPNLKLMNLELLTIDKIFQCFCEMSSASGGDGEGWTIGAFGEMTEKASNFLKPKGGHDAVGAFVLLFVIAFLPTKSMKDREVMHDVMVHLSSTDQHSWKLFSSWFKLAQCIFLGAPLIAFGEEVRLEADCWVIVFWLLWLVLTVCLFFAESLQVATR